MEQHAGAQQGPAALDGIFGHVREDTCVLGGLGEPAAVLTQGRQGGAGLAAPGMQRRGALVAGGEALGLLELDVTLGGDHQQVADELGLTRTQLEAGVEAQLDRVDRGEGVAPAAGGVAVAGHGGADLEVVGVVAQGHREPAVGLGAAIRELEQVREQDQAGDQVLLIAQEPEGLDGALEHRLGLGEQVELEQDCPEGQAGRGVVGVGGEGRLEAATCGLQGGGAGVDAGRRGVDRGGARCDGLLRGWGRAWAGRGPGGRAGAWRGRVAGLRNDGERLLIVVAELGRLLVDVRDLVDLLGHLLCIDGLADLLDVVGLGPGADERAGLGLGRDVGERVGAGRLGGVAEVVGGGPLARVAEVVGAGRLGGVAEVE